VVLSRHFLNHYPNMEGVIRAWMYDILNLIARVDLRSHSLDASRII
jgi:hypothetical protein